MRVCNFIFLLQLVCEGLDRKIHAAKLQRFRGFVFASIQEPEGLLGKQ